MDRKIRILIAEKDPAFVRQIEVSLKESKGSFQVHSVSSGEACREQLQKGKSDILLLDHDLPDGAGLQWLQRFNEEGIGVPTIFVTAKGDSHLALQAMKEGVFDYINRSAECAKAFPFVVQRAVEGHGLMTEKVRLQKELIVTKNFLESVVEKAGDAISAVDLGGTILYWNEGAERIYGYSKDEAMGKKLSALLYPRDGKLRAAEEKTMEELIARVKRGDVISNVEVKRRTREGKEIITSMTVSPLKDAEGQIIGASRICRDITHLKKAEERLHLAERLSSLGELSAGVAHEIRNPLAGIKINTQILSRQKDLTDMERQLLESTQDGIAKIQNIVEDMLHFAKPKAAHFAEEDISEVIAQSLSILEMKIKKAHITPRLEQPEGLPRIWIDPNQIQQVVINLILNAIQAMAKGGTLTLRTRREDGGVAVEVRDTGIGIPEALLKKIFDPFFTTKSEGTGLGLSISLKILENHGATIDVSSVEGQGSVFTLHFPGGKSHGV